MATDRIEKMCVVVIIVGLGLVSGGLGARLPRDTWSAEWERVADGNSSKWPDNQFISDGNSSDRGNSTTSPIEDEEEEIERFQVAHFDFDYVKTNLMISIWVLFASIAKIVFHSHKKLEQFFPESCLLIVVGIILGLILFFSTGNDNSYQLNVNTFFLILLPPIILDAGYFMPSRSFFDNLGTILLYAVIGTLLNTLWIGFSLWGVDQANGFSLDQPLELLHCLVFASLLAAVDPVAVLAVFESVHVNEMLHIVVFGESLLNDGISVVLYHMFEGFSEIGMHNIVAVDIISGIGSFFVIVIGATAIGIVCGLAAGFASRFTRHVRVMEPLLIVVVGYLSFLLAEMFHLSGILSCTFCGITMRKYVEVNISQKSQITIKYLLKMMASVTETIIFMYLGISAVSKAHIWNTGFVLLTLIFCLIYRTLGVIILTFIANRVRLVRLTKIDQFIMAYGGLRGAIAFALSVLLSPVTYPHKELFVTTTVVIVYFTNLVMGSTVKPLVRFLNVKQADDGQLNMNEKLTLRLMDHLMAGIEDLSGQKGHHLLRERFSHFNNKYLKPIIIGRHHPSQKRGYEIFNVYKRLSMKDAKEMARNPLSATSLNRIQTHIKRLSSMDTSSGTQHLSEMDLSQYDMSQWRNWFGSSPNLRDFSPEGYTASGHYGEMTMNGGFNIDRVEGRITRTGPSSDEGIDELESADISFSPHPHIYRRHMLSCASIPKLSNILEAPAGCTTAPTSSPFPTPPPPSSSSSSSSSLSPSNSEVNKHRVSFSADIKASDGRLSSDSVSHEDGSAITFNVGPCHGTGCDGRASMPSYHSDDNIHSDQHNAVTSKHSGMHERHMDHTNRSEHPRHVTSTNYSEHLDTSQSDRYEEKNGNMEADLSRGKGIENEGLAKDEDSDEEDSPPTKNEENVDCMHTQNKSRECSCSEVPSDGSRCQQPEVAQTLGDATTTESSQL